ncbi:PP2C family protein-serine/threonine phosphatase [Streptomyces sp. NPDC093795]|uniref:PP2C family protein-serine/threonine phosphatase n=1 Tax=Streptomyces sp. NPDC093795 TaxID=3366051 RepID=UPI00381F8742
MNAAAAPGTLHIPIDHHSAVQAAADQARALARQCRMPGALPDQAAVLASELASNISGNGHGRLTLSLRLPHRRAFTTVAVEQLPLPGETTTDGTMVWRMPTPPAAAPTRSLLPSPGGRSRKPSPDSPAGLPTAGETDLALVEEELRAALAKGDSLTSEHRRLKHELAETNSGVLALYVQLEERDEELRRAHGRTLRALEDALRPPPLHVDGLELAVHYAPAGTDDPTGGDLYDWFVLPDGTLHVTIVDALGHGITAPAPHSPSLTPYEPWLSRAIPSTASWRARTTSSRPWIKTSWPRFS